MQLSNNTFYKLTDEPNLQKQNTNFGTLKQIVASQKKNTNIYQKNFHSSWTPIFSEAVVGWCSVEKVFLEISENTFFYRTPPVAAFLFYGLPKTHKCFEKFQPLRQIVSGLRYISASLSKYIDCFLKYQAKTWKSYIGA